MAQIGEWSLRGQLVGDGDDALRVAIAHPQRLLAEALRQLVRAFGASVVGIVCDRESLLNGLPDVVVDVLILDEGLDPAGGIVALLDEVGTAAPDTRVIVLAERFDTALALLAEEGQLDGLVLTSEVASDLGAALAQVASRHAIFPAGWLRRAHAAAAANPLADLTPRQREVLRLLAGGLDNAAIARRLYISPNTVKAHVRAIYRILDVHNRVEATRALASSPVRAIEDRPEGLPTLPRGVDAVAGPPA